MSATLFERLNFDSPLAPAHLLRAVDHHPFNERTVIVNLATTDAFIGQAQLAPLPPLSSTILVNGTVTGALLIAVALRDIKDQEQTARDLGWIDFYGPGNSVLLKSPQETIGVIDLDRQAVLHQISIDPAPRSFTVKANLWFSPAGTDCGIHIEHPFIEVHTQISGYGRMQKFTANDRASLYEDQQLSPGTTNPIPFCIEDAGSFIYPWHQYRADTDCVWLALEFHEN